MLSWSILGNCTLTWILSCFYRCSSVCSKDQVKHSRVEVCQRLVVAVDSDCSGTHCEVTHMVMKVSFMSRIRDVTVTIRITVKSRGMDSTESGDNWFKASFIYHNCTWTWWSCFLFSSLIFPARTEILYAVNLSKNKVNSCLSLVELKMELVQGHN